MSWYDLGAGVAAAAKQLEKCALSRSTQGSPGVGDDDSGPGICCGESYGDLLRVRDVRGTECESLYLFVFVNDCGRIPSPHGVGQQHPCRRPKGKSRIDSQRP